VRPGDRRQGPLESALHVGPLNTDTITDFEIGVDRVDVSGAGISDFDDLIAHTTQLGSELMIEGAWGDQLILENVVSGFLTEADFIF
jgi:hypothetical protein